MPELTPTTRVTQGSVHVPLARIHTCRVEEVKIDELSLDNDDCVLASDPTEDSDEDPGALIYRLQAWGREK